MSGIVRCESTGAHDVADPSIIMLPARVYAGICESAFAIVSGTASCVGAVGNAALDTWTQGLRKSVTDLGSSAFGINKFSQAVKVLKRGENDTRELPKRIGEAAGFTMDGLTRMVTVGTGLVAYTSGSVSNLLDMRAEPESLQNASKQVAQGMNCLFSYLPSIALASLKASGEALRSANTLFLCHPHACIKGSGLALTTYIAASNLVQAVDRPRWQDKIYHAFGTIAGCGLTYAVYKA